MHNERTVTGPSDVELDAINPERNCCSKRVERIFAVVKVESPVGVDEWHPLSLALSLSATGSISLKFPLVFEVSAQ